MKTIRTLALGALLALSAAACTDDSGLDNGNNAAPLSPETRITATANSAGIGTVGTRTTGADDANAPTPQNCLAGGEKTLAMLAEAGENSFVLLAPEMQHDYKADATTTAGTNYQCLMATPTAVTDDKGTVTSLSFDFSTMDDQGNTTPLPNGLLAKYLRTDAPAGVKNRAHLLGLDKNSNYYAAADRKGGSNYTFALRNANTKVSVTLTDKETGNAINQTADAAKAITIQLTNIGQTNKETVYRKGENNPWETLEDPTADLSDVTDVRFLTTNNGDKLITSSLTNATRTEGTDKKTTHIWNILIAPQTFDGVRANAALLITLPAGSAGNPSELTFSKKLSEITVTTADGKGTASLSEVKENQHLILNVTLDGLHNLAVSATLSDWTMATAAYGSTANTDDANYGLETEDFNGGKRYLIRNATDLQLFAEMVNLNTGTANAPSYPNASANARVTADFTFALTDEWIGIGNNSGNTGQTLYLGIFDGDGHTIHLTGTGKSGLFGNIGMDGVVRGLTLAGFTNGGRTYIANNTYTVGAMANTNNGTIENCQVKGFENRSKVAGGLIGENYSSGTIKACAAYDCYLQAGYSEAGGLVAINEGTITACIAIPYRVGTDESGSIGWLVGTNSGTVSNCACIAGRDDASDAIGYNTGIGTNNGICIDLPQFNATTLKTDGTGEGGIAILNTAKITLSDNNAYYWAPGKDQNATPVLTPIPDAGKGEAMQIATARHLCLFALLVNAGNTTLDATLTNDISMKSIKVWKAIGVHTVINDRYKGTLDGANHAILDFAPATMVMNEDNAGLFGTAAGTISNLTLRRGRYEVNTETNRAGALVGQNYATLTNCHVEDFSITANMKADMTLGCLVGYAGHADKPAAITACTVTRCSITNIGTNAYMGGLTGHALGGGSFTACAAYACTITSNSTGTLIGGLVGKNDFTLTACISTPAAIKSSSSQIGYLVGNNSSGNVVTCAYGKCAGVTQEIGNNSGGTTDGNSFALYKTDGSGALVDNAITKLNNAIAASTLTGINKEWQWTTIGARPVKK